MNEKLIEVRETTLVYTVREKGFIFDHKKRENVLDNVSLDISKGEIISILGASGSGKSMLAQMAALRIKPDSGQVLFKGQDFYKAGRSDQKKMKKLVSYLSQDSHAFLDNEQTAFDYIISDDDDDSDDNETKKTDTAKSALANVFKKLGLNPDDRKRLNGQFSGGQRQLLTLAKALYPNPELIVADQPVNALDPPTRKHIVNIFKKLAKEEGKALILISHHSDLLRISDRIVLIDEGRIVEDTPGEAFFQNPATEIGRKWLEVYSRSVFNPELIASLKR